MGKLKIERVMGIFVLMLFLSISPGGLFAKELYGTGVGNGGEGARARKLQELKREMENKLSDSKSNLDYLYKWCGNVTGVLKKELRKADELIRRENLISAKEVLIDALLVASESYNSKQYSEEPTIKKMINKALYYAQALEGVLVNQKPAKLSLLTELLFLKGYLNLIFVTEEKLDRPFYIPYHHKYGKCRKCPQEFNLEDFVKRYFEYAVDELSFILEQFTRTIYLYGEEQFVPVGRVEAFLKLTELGAGFVAEEIANTFEGYYYADEVIELVTLSEEIRDFLLFNDTTVFWNVPDAFKKVAPRFKNIIMQLGNGSTSYQEDVQTDLLPSSIILSERNPFERVLTKSGSYIRGINLRMEARGSAARIAVMVNGKLKSDPYIPAVDPSYYVAIGEYADSIELKHLNGGAVIVYSIIMDY